MGKKKNRAGASRLPPDVVAPSARSSVPPSKDRSSHPPIAAEAVISAKGEADASAVVDKYAVAVHEPSSSAPSCPSEADVPSAPRDPEAAATSCVEAPLDMALSSADASGPSASGTSVAAVAPVQFQSSGVQDPAVSAFSDDLEAFAGDEKNGAADDPVQLHQAEDQCDGASDAPVPAAPQLNAEAESEPQGDGSVEGDDHTQQSQAFSFILQRVTTARRALETAAPTISINQLLSHTIISKALLTLAFLFALPVVVICGLPVAFLTATLAMVVGSAFVVLAVPLGITVILFCHIVQRLRASMQQ